MEPSIETFKTPQPVSEEDYRKLKMPLVSHMWAELPLDDHWRARYRLMIQDGRPVIGELRIVPREDGAQGPYWSADVLGPAAPVPAGGVTSTLVRKVPVRVLGSTFAELGQHVRRVRRLKLQGPAAVVFSDPVWDQLAEEPERQDSTPKSRSGRKGKPDRFYAELARDYASLVAANDPHPVLTLVAKRRGSSVSLIRSAIKRARDRDLLTKAHPGQGLGDLTPKGRRVLRQKRKTVKAKRKPRR